MLIEVFPDKIRVYRDKESSMRSVEHQRGDSNLQMMITNNTHPYTGDINWQKIAHECIFSFPPLPRAEVRYIMTEDDEEKERNNWVEFDNVTMVVTPTYLIFTGVPYAERYNREWDICHQIGLHTNRWSGDIDWLAVGDNILHKAGYYHCKCVNVEYQQDPEEEGFGGSGWTYKPTSEDERADAVSGSGSLINPYVL
jgi:hypothetical protein